MLRHGGAHKRPLIAPVNVRDQLRRAERQRIGFSRSDGVAGGFGVSIASGCRWSGRWRAPEGRAHGGIYETASVYTARVAKHLVDLDEEALSAAQAELGTSTIRDTVNKALERAASGRHRRVASALDVLAKADLEDRSEAWR
jgi:Arc/MetJ family transcription regulator